MNSPGKTFKKIIEDEGYILTGGVYDAISAKVAAMAGTRSLYLSGYSQSLGLLGRSDMEFVQRYQAVDNARRIVEALEDGGFDCPVIADADTGYGSVNQVQYTVRSFERAGVAGVHLEDQTIPKRCGHIAGKTVLPMEESVGKIKAAVDAKIDKDFVIIARTDALGAAGGSMQDAVNRAVAYHDAGADMIWCEFGSASRELAKEFSTSAKKLRPNMGLAFNYSSSFRWHEQENPMVAEELSDMGYKFIFITLFGIHSATVNVFDEFLLLKEKGVEAQWQLERWKKDHPTESHHVMGDTAKYQEVEMKYLPTVAAQRIEKSEGYKEKGGENDAPR